jgi:hypothetical protein
MKSRTILLILLLAVASVIVSCSKGSYSAAVRSDAAGNGAMVGSKQENTAVPSPYTDGYKDKQVRKYPKQ